MTPAVEWEYSLYLAMFPLYFSQLIENLRFHKMERGNTEACCNSNTRNVFHYIFTVHRICILLKNALILHLNFYISAKI